MTSIAWPMALPPSYLERRRSSYQVLRGIAHDCRVSGYVADHHCTHTDHCARADAHALPDHRPGSDIGAVADSHVAIAAHTRRERDKITDAAVMLDITGDI